MIFSSIFKSNKNIISKLNRKKIEKMLFKNLLRKKIKLFNSN